MTQIPGEPQSAVWQVPHRRAHCSQWIIQSCIRACMLRTLAHSVHASAHKCILSGSRYASRCRLEMEMEVEVCHRVNGPFFSPFSSCSSFSSSSFFVFLFLLPGRLVSWPSGLHGCISLGHEPLSFCRTLSLSDPPLPAFLPLRLFSASPIAPRTRRRSPWAAKALFYRVKSRWWTSFPTSSTYIVIYHDSGKQVRYTGWRQIRVRSLHSRLSNLQSILFYRKFEKNEISLLKFN